MKNVKVTYTTQAVYAAQNAANIQQVMADLQALQDPGIFYFATLSPDGKTFTHIAFFKSEEDQKTLFELPSFQHFQTQLKASMPEVPPQQEFPTLVGASHSIFNTTIQ